MEKIILFGGLGFVGKNFVEYFSARYEIHIIDKQENELFLRNYPIYFYKKDVLKDSLENLMRKIQPDFIINFISLVTAERDWAQFPKMSELHTQALLRIYEDTKKLESLKLFVQIGSAEEYGDVQAPYVETCRENPYSPYGITKLAATHLTMALYQNNHYPAVVLRPSNLFGKYQEANKFIPYIVQQIVANNILYLSNCEQKRDYLFVYDFLDKVESVLLNAEKVRGEIFNIASGKSVKLKEIVDFSCRYFNSQSQCNYGAIATRENEAMNLLSDTTKFDSMIGIHSDIDFWERYRMYLDTKKTEK